MTFTIRIKYLLMLMVSIVILIYAAVNASAEGPSVYFRYYEGEGSVVASVYWDDTNHYDFNWAHEMNSGGSDLNWMNTGFERFNQNTIDNYAVVTLTKYKNYYFKISNGSEVTVVRSYPSDFNNPVNPGRKQNDYAHGNFTPDTTMCGTCHSTHTSLKGQLLKQSTYYDLCMLCHSNSNSQSKYDVEIGMVYMGPLNKWVSSPGGPIGVGVGTSAHDVNDKFNTTVNVPGSDPDPSKVLTFTCISCHTAHGGTNDNYRLIRKNLYPSNTKWREKTVHFAAYAVVTDFSKGEEVSFVEGGTEFCTACHLDYDKGNSVQAGGEYDVYKRHPVSVGTSVYSVFSSSPLKDLYPAPGDNLPLQYYAEGESKTGDKRTAVVCETCHFAHGTRKSFVVSGSENAGKNLLRLDNYGVCESCHKK